MANNVLPALTVKKMPIDKLSSDPKNARKHGAANLEAIKRSLLAFGLQKPIVVTPKGIIVAGHGTVAAAAELGWSEIDVVVTKLKDADIKAFAIADNRSAELAEWDLENLGHVMHELREIDYDLADTGFELDDFEELYGEPAKPKAGKLVAPPLHDGAADGEATKTVSFEAKVGGSDAPTDESGVAGQLDAASAKSNERDLGNLRVELYFTPAQHAELQKFLRYFQSELQINAAELALLEVLRSAYEEYTEV